MGLRSLLGGTTNVETFLQHNNETLLPLPSLYNGTALHHPEPGGDHNFEHHFTARSTFYIVFQLAYMPVILVGASLTLVTVYLVQSLHTAHNSILCAIAVLDLWTTVVFSTFQVSKNFPRPGGSHGPAVLTDRWICTFHFNNAAFGAYTALDLLTLLVVNRFAMTYMPIWYVAHINGKRRILIGVSASIVVVRVATQVVTFIYKGLEDLGDDNVWTAKQCELEHTVIEYVLKIQSYIMGIEMVVCCVLNAAIVSMYCKNHGIWGMQCGGGRRHRNQEAKWNAIQLTGLVIPSLILWTPTIIYEMSRDDWSDIARLCRLINAGLHAPINAASKKVYRDSFRYLLKTSPCKWKLLPRWLHRKSEYSGKVKDQLIKMERVIPAMLDMLHERSEQSRRESSRPRSDSVLTHSRMVEGPLSTSSGCCYTTGEVLGKTKRKPGSIVFTIIDSMVYNFPDMLVNHSSVDDKDEIPDRNGPSTSVSADKSVGAKPSPSLQEKFGQRTPSIFSPHDDEWHPRWTLELVRKELDTEAFLSPQSSSSNSRSSPSPLTSPNSSSPPSSPTDRAVDRVQSTTAVLRDSFMDSTMKWFRDSVHKPSSDI